MTASDVERLARDVIVQHGLPFTVQSVIGSPIGWTISVRTSGTGAMVRFIAAGARPDFIRRTIEEILDAQY
jgi:hypothetical protein